MRDGSSPTEPPPASENRARSAEVIGADEAPEQATEATPPASGRVSSVKPTAGQPVPASEPDSTEMAPVNLLDTQPASFAVVTEKPQLLAEKGVDTRVETLEVPTDKELVAAAAQAEPKPQAGSTVSEEPVVQSETDESVGHDSSVMPDASIDVSVDEPLAVEMAPKLSSEKTVIRHWRIFALAAGALTLLIVGFLAIHSRRPIKKPDQASAMSNIGLNQAEHAVPIAVTNQATPAQAAAATASAATSAEIGASEPVHPAAAAGVGAQAESFSDAFAKHAATVNSSWAEVKKRPKLVESSGQPIKPNTASNAKADDNPLDLLDKLEKARKAKKQNGNKAGSP